MSRAIKHEPCPKCRDAGRDTRGDNLVIYSDGGAHCFSCGYHRFPRIEENLAFSLSRVDNEKIRAKNKAVLPDDFTRDVPVAALKWLLQYELPWSYWKETIGFSPKEARLVFLVGNPVQFSIGRYIPELAVAPRTGSHAMRRKWYVWGDSHKHAEVVGGNGSGSVVLVEDLISAHKLAYGTNATAVPLFGTMLHPCHLYYIRQEQRPVIIWLDKDQQGLVGKKANQLAVLTGVPVRTITTAKDPKCLSLTEIRNQLQ